MSGNRGADRDYYQIGQKMRDGISEIAVILISVIVLLVVPTILYLVEADICTEAKAEEAIYRTVTEANGDGLLTRAEIEYILKISAIQKHPLHIGLYSMEGVNNGRFGEYLYCTEEKQLYELLEREESICLPEGGVLGAYR